MPTRSTSSPAGKKAAPKKSVPPPHGPERADPDRAVVAKDFAAAVNMTPAALETWLGTPESKEVGWVHEGEHESVGHQFGRHILDIRRKKKADLTDADFEHMRKVIGYVHRHMAQRPAGDIRETRWRYSLMNWGHDPAK